MKNSLVFEHARKFLNCKIGSNEFEKMHLSYTEPNPGNFSLKIYAKKVEFFRVDPPPPPHFVLEERVILGIGTL
jgi:hypothetical protein